MSVTSQVTPRFTLLRDLWGLRNLLISTLPVIIVSGSNFFALGSTNVRPAECRIALQSHCNACYTQASA